MNEQTPVKNTPKKKADLGVIAFAKVNKLEKRVSELEKLLLDNKDLFSKTKITYHSVGDNQWAPSIT